MKMFDEGFGDFWWVVIIYFSLLYNFNNLDVLVKIRILIFMREYVKSYFFLIIFEFVIDE